MLLGLLRCISLERDLLASGSVARFQNVTHLGIRRAGGDSC
jgi:hypothetical protein